MCSFSQPKAPPPVVVPPAPVVEPPAPAVTPDSGDTAAQQQRVAEKQRRLRNSSENTTLVTGGQGVMGNANTGGKQLFGA